MFCTFLVVCFCNLVFISCLPLNWIQKIAEGHHFDDFENYLPKFGDLPKFQYPLNNKRLNDNKEEEIIFKKHNETQNEKSAIKDYLESFNKSTNGFNDEDNSIETNFTNSPTYNIQNVSSSINTTDLTTKNSTFNEDNTEFETLNSLNFTINSLTSSNDTNRFARQKLEEDNGIDDDDDDDDNKDEKDDKDLEKEEQVDESSEEEGNMVTGLLGSLLGSLSRPDGSIDLEAITSLLGSLSTQNPDGSYDFNGLTELLMGFFGGGEEGGGGSDIAGFLGGLVGAVLKGSAQNPPGGGKGVGLFTGKLVGNLLPSLSGPPPSDDENAPPGGSDPLGFVGGLLQGIFSGSGGLSNSTGLGSAGSSSGGGGKGEQGGGSKFQIFKAIFSVITGLFTSSSGNKSH